MRWPSTALLSPPRRDRVRRYLAEAVAAALQAERDSREAALLAALRPAVLGFAKAGAARAETAISVTVLASAEGEAAVEAALDALAPEHLEAATIDMRGPLPPLSFTAVRLVTVPEHDVFSAWQTLSLPDRIDLATLHRQWRLRAAAVHPDRQASQAVPAEDVTVSEMTSAYRLLRDLLPRPDTAETFTLPGLLRRAGPRLVMPEFAGPELVVPAHGVPEISRAGARSGPRVFTLSCLWSRSG